MNDITYRRNKTSFNRAFKDDILTVHSGGTTHRHKHARTHTKVSYHHLTVANQQIHTFCKSPCLMQRLLLTSFYSHLRGAGSKFPVPMEIILAVRCYLLYICFTSVLHQTSRHLVKLIRFNVTYIFKVYNVLWYPVPLWRQTLWVGSFRWLFINRVDINVDSGWHLIKKKIKKKTFGFMIIAFCVFVMFCLCLGLDGVPLDFLSVNPPVFFTILCHLIPPPCLRLDKSGDKSSFKRLLKTNLWCIEITPPNPLLCCVASPLQEEPDQAVSDLQPHAGWNQGHLPWRIFPGGHVQDH